MIGNRTKIICTIGPTSEQKSVIEKMIHAGMDCVRLNFSHGTYDSFTSIIKNVREVSKEMGREIAIIQDLQGPKIRIGELPEEGVKDAHGDVVVLSIHKEKDPIPIQYKHLPHGVHDGDLILIDDGLIELKVESVNAKKTQIKCVVLVEGVIKTHKGINVPTASITAHPISAKDRRDVFYGIS